MARAALGAALGARVPAVGEQGVVRLDGATHPLLASAAATGAAAPAGGVTAVVGNRLELGGEGCPQGLVLTGPNGGGKSVALKTVGLAALLVRCAVPVPCSPARDGEGEGGGGSGGGGGGTLPGRESVRHVQCVRPLPPLAAPAGRGRRHRPASRAPAQRRRGERGWHLGGVHARSIRRRALAVQPARQPVQRPVRGALHLRRRRDERVRHWPGQRASFVHRLGRRLPAPLARPGGCDSRLAPRRHRRHRTQRKPARPGEGRLLRLAARPRRRRPPLRRRRRLLHSRRRGGGGSRPRALLRRRPLQGEGRAAPILAEPRAPLLRAARRAATRGDDATETEPTKRRGVGGLKDHRKET
mmetsp:Transcript_12555/g.40039  ORF Transcript_12555/g.40039 Transcript_12555/m.40039 type:complete len:357 (-) Transcript_12555:34-1104(-)